jgi:hypothetical protein
MLFFAMTSEFSAETHHQVFISRSVIPRTPFNLCLEFTPHQREMFCVFSGQGVIGLRRHLNDETIRVAGTAAFDDEANEGHDDDNQTMTGMMSATALNGEEEVDEELEDAEESHNGIDVGGEAQP